MPEQSYFEYQHNKFIPIRFKLEIQGYSDSKKMRPSIVAIQKSHKLNRYTSGQIKNEFTIYLYLISIKRRQSNRKKCQKLRISNINRHSKGKCTERK